MKALIIDDELNCRDNLKWMLQNYCPEMSEITMAASAGEANNLLSDFAPEVVFLDIQMPGENGIEWLESLTEVPFSVVFTTAHSEFALKALRLHAFDYLEKPISLEELQHTVTALLKRNGHRAAPKVDDIKALVREVYREQEEQKIAVAMREGYEIIDTRDIVRLEADESYTTFHLANGKKLMSSKNIKVYEDKLDPITFFRTHKSHIINLRQHLKGFNRLDGSAAVMSNGHQVPISRRKLQHFLDRISEW